MTQYPGIDYDFRPTSYWDDKNALAAILRDVKGTLRRQMIIDYWNAGQYEKLENELTQATISARLQYVLGRIHPTWMGGEYLPNYHSGETEIARISLKSTLSDVISIRATRRNGKLRYRVVDEYETRFERPLKTSSEPFMLRELIAFLDGTKYPDDVTPLPLANNEGNCVHQRRPEELRHFTVITSLVYPELEQHYERVFDDWCAQESAR